MPRVNRDLQRRMAARRERERRRPNGDRRYRFAGPESEIEPDNTLVEPEAEATEPAELAPRRSRSRQARTAAPAPPSQTGTARIAKPFSAYRDEYAYVYGDLRRVGVVIGSLLLVLIVLFFVLPVLAR